MLVARALKIGKIADGGMPPTYETMHYLGPRQSSTGRSPGQSKPPHMHAGFT